MEGKPSRSPRGQPTSAWLGRRWRPDGSDIFCAHDGQPSQLLEPLASTAHFLLVPDRNPITPGHMLIVPKEHYPCYGAVPARLEPELRGLIERASQFSRANYGEPLIWENGIAGQSVHHAHLHLIPMPASVRGLPTPVMAVSIAGFSQVRRWFSSGRLYHLMWLGRDRRLLPAGSPDVQTASLFKGAVLKVPVTPDGRHWIRQHNAAEIQRLRDLWSKQMQPPSRGGHGELSRGL